MVRNSWICCILVLLSCGGLFAGIALRLDGGVREQSGVTMLAQDNDYTLSVVCDGQADKVMIDGVQDSEHFQVYRGGTSSKMQMINGAVQASVSYQYHIRPFDTGEYVLGPATAVVHGTEETSKSIRVRVVSADEYEKKAGRSRPGQGTLSCRLEVDTPSVVVGEQAVVSVILEDEGQAQERSLQPPSFGSLSFAQIGEPVAKQFIDNGIAKVRVVQKYGVSADQPGSYLIGPAIAHFVIPSRNNNDPFDAFFGMQMHSFFGGGQKKSVRSNSLEFTVTGLPEHTTPVDGVGQFESFTASSESAVVELNEPFTLKLALRGRGNFDAILAPELTASAHMNVYDSSSTFTPDRGQNNVGTKTFEYVVQIERDGEHTIPAQTFTYYNTETQSYESLQSRPLQIRVKAARTASSSGAIEEAPLEPYDDDDGEVALNEADERYDDEPMVPRQSGISWVFFLFLLIVPALWLLRNRMKNLMFMMSERFGVTSQDKRDALTIKEMVKKGNVESIHGFFMEVLSRHWGYAPEAIDATQIQAWTEQWGWQESEAEGLVSFIEQCEQAAFAPQLISAAAKKALLAKAEYWHQLLVAARKG